MELNLIVGSRKGDPVRGGGIDPACFSCGSDHRYDTAVVHANLLLDGYHQEVRIKTGLFVKRRGWVSGK